MESNNIWAKFQHVLNEVPNFITDETAQIPNKQGSISRTYKYLNLATILKTIKPVFAKYDLGFTQRVTFEYGSDNKGMQVGTVETIIFDETDRVTLSRYPFVVTGDPQANGSAVTYARRYALYAVLGIYPEKDDDGVAARDYAKPSEPTISREQADQLTTLCRQAHVNVLAEVGKRRGSKVTRLSEITIPEYEGLTAWIMGGQNA